MIRSIVRNHHHSHRWEVSTQSSPWLISGSDTEVKQYNGRPGTLANPGCTESIIVDLFICCTRSPFIFSSFFYSLSLSLFLFPHTRFVVSTFLLLLLRLLEPHVPVGRHVATMRNLLSSSRTMHTLSLPPSLSPLSYIHTYTYTYTLSIYLSSFFSISLHLSLSFVVGLVCCRVSIVPVVVVLATTVDPRGNARSAY